MPIKPENRARYPDNWPELRESILARAGHCCERCRVSNYAEVERGRGRDAGTYRTVLGKVYCDTSGTLLREVSHGQYAVARVVKIVLTIAHLDHTPENNDPDNLQALCQKCHLAHDAPHHRANAAATRRKKLASGDLFELPG